MFHTVTLHHNATADEIREQAVKCEQNAIYAAQELERWRTMAEAFRRKADDKESQDPRKHVGHRVQVVREAGKVDVITCTDCDTRLALPCTLEFDERDRVVTPRCVEPAPHVIVSQWQRGWD